jgi:hypothetical protein
MLASVGAASVSALEAPAPCCACVEISGASLPPIQAFFCGYFPGAQLNAAEIRCEALNVTSDPGLVCYDATAVTCAATLAAANFACPLPAAAPTASTTVLAAIVVVLAGIGCFARRRAESRR